ncbi:MAG TPA: PilZ domain-containing protein [Blastocatellia bacterium]|nr:PilZ domain-containing protein [Blastocatellia bacterium]
MKGSGAFTKSSGGLNKSAQGHVKRPGNTGKLINEHYLEIEYVLERVEGSTTHYQLLGLERSATNEQIVVAYHETVAVLHPSYYKVRAALPDDLLEKVDSAFGRVSQAFLILTDSNKRTEYDRSLKRRKVVPLPLDAPKQKRARGSGGLKKPRPASGALDKREQSEKQDGNKETVDVKVAQAATAFAKLSSEATAENRRRCQRFNLLVPVLVAGYDRDGSRWQEVSKTIDVSRMGVAIRLVRRVRHGCVLHVTLPLPTKLRSHGFTEPGYNMYAIVRRVEPVAGGTRVVGVEFIGSHPPAGYLNKPWALFRTQKWDGPDRRREPRREVAESVLIEYLDDAQTIIAREVTRTENVSESGARVAVKSAPAVFDMVKVTSANRAFEGLAFVRNRYAANDGCERLCLQFKDNKWLADG